MQVSGAMAGTLCSAQVLTCMTNPEDTGTCCGAVLSSSSQLLTHFLQVTSLEPLDRSWHWITLEGCSGRSGRERLEECAVTPLVWANMCSSLLGFPGISFYSYFVYIHTYAHQQWDRNVGAGVSKIYSITIISLILQNQAREMEHFELLAQQMKLSLWQNLLTTF